MRRSIPAAALLACALTASAATATTPEDVARDPGFEAMLARVDAAQLEHLRYVPPGQAEPVTRDYRVTMIFRREAGEWRLLHRQADTNLSRPPVR